MRRVLCIGVASIVCGAVVLLSADAVRAGTIIKLNLGGDNSTDIAFDGTNLSTLDDLGPGPGNQDTGVDFLDILSPLTDIPSAHGVVQPQRACESLDWPRSPTAW